MKNIKINKKNKKIAGILSCILVGSIAVTTTCGLLIKPNVIKNQTSNNDKRIKFDKNNKLIYPIMYDPENPSGIYKNELPNVSSSVVTEEMKNSKEYKSDLPKFIEEQKKHVFSLYSQEMLETKIIVNDDYKLFLDNIIPGININTGEEISISNLVDTCFEQSQKNYSESAITPEHVNELCSLVGVNFKKEYNSIIESLNNIDDNISTYGGGGGGDTTVDSPHVGHIEGKNSPEKDEKVLNEDSRARFTLNLSYSIVMPTLIAIEAVTSFFTFGIAIASTVIDIIFTSTEIALLWTEYSDVNDLISLIHDGVVNFADKPYSELREMANRNPNVYEFIARRDRGIWKTKQAFTKNRCYVGNAVSLMSLAAKTTVNLLYDYFSELIDNE